MKKTTLLAIVITSSITAYPAISKAMVLGTFDFVGSGGSSGFLTELEFRLDTGLGYIGPLFEISWVAGHEHVGDTLFVSAETDAYFGIAAYVLSNGVSDRIAFEASGGGRGGTDCSFFTKSPGVDNEYCDFHGCNITAISLTVNALTLEHPTDSWTNYSYDVTFTVWGDPPVPTPAMIYYVDADASGANNGSSWANAYRYLQDALLAASRGDEIWVAQGIYKPDRGAGMMRGDRTATFQPINGVTIKGGYAGASSDDAASTGFGQPDPNARDIDKYETILSGDLSGDDGPNFANNGENSYHVVTETGTDETAVLDGFTISAGNGMSRSGGGMYNHFCKPTVINCTFSENSARYGGGMYNWGSNPTLTNCIFISNFGRSGGGMYNRRGSPTLDNCMFTANSSTSEGAGIYNYRNSSPILTNCTFAANSAANGNALAFDSPQHRRYPSTLKMTNCILWDGGDEIWNGDNSMITITYSDVQGGWSGESNIDTDPCFVEPGYWDANGTPNDPNDDFWVDGDYRLLSDSPCINAGDPNYIAEPNETDLDGKPRVIGGRIDMGAYEFNHIPVADAGPDREAYAWIDGIAEVTLDGTGSYDDDGHLLTYNWSWTIDGETYDVNGVTPVIELPVGEQTIELIVNDGIDDSEPDEVVITVIPPMESQLRIAPRVINRHSHQPGILALVRLPQGVTADQIDSGEPLLLYPDGIEAIRQRVTESRSRGASIFALFDKAELMDTVTANGSVELQVVGNLKTGQYFGGTDTVLVIGNW